MQPKTLKESMSHLQMVQTPTGPLALIRPVAEQLLKGGVISGTLDGVLHAADAATVKAAMMTTGVCDFCSAPGVTDGFDVTDFDLPGGLGRSTGGWAACDTCAALVRAGKRKELLERAIGSLAFAKFTKPAIQDLHGRFWTGLEAYGRARGMAEGLAQFIEDKLPEPETLAATIVDRTKRLEAISRLSGLSIEELEQAVTAGTKGTDLPTGLATKLLDWSKRFGKTLVDGHTLLDLVDGLDGIRKPMQAAVVPHWQQALDAQFEVVRTLQGLLRDTTQTEVFPEKAVDLTDAMAMLKVAKQAKARNEFRALGFDEDLRVMRSAQAYSFNAETEAAIIEASASIPHDAPLSSIETPNTGAGWFWFGEPLKVAASPVASDHTHALLWSWVGGDYVDIDLATMHEQKVSPEPALLFSAYVRDEKGGIHHGKMFPSTRWHWPLHLSFHDMLAFNAGSWDHTYGPGTAMEHDPYIISRKDTLSIIADLSLFFVMACVWFRQTVPGEPKKKLNPILTQTPGHIERHARKRYQREHKLKVVPTVQVVALRKTARTAVEDAPTERAEGARHYSCRWIVKGHPRLQPCGPGRKDRKLIWIDAYPAGPEDKPLKTKTTTVYAVVR